MSTEARLDTLAVIPLAEVDTPQLFAFAAALVDQPRFFGAGAVPPPSARWRSKLCHPAGVRGVAALIGGELVGVARVSPRPAHGVELYIAVAAPWRRQGIGTALAAAATRLARTMGEQTLIAVSDHRKASARAMARHLSSEATLVGPYGVEFHTRLAS